METFLLATANGDWDGPWWGGIVFFLLLAVFLAFIIFKLWWRPWRWHGGDWPEKPDQILKRRLAGGQIDEAEYKHLLDLLDRPGREGGQ
jgi:uncharacterized membrane protein